MSDASMPHETCVGCGTVEPAYLIGQLPDGRALCEDCARQRPIMQCSRCGVYMSRKSDTDMCGSCWDDVLKPD